jgi:ABC-type phosphate transport system substrate-binding protein
MKMGNARIKMLAGALLLCAGGAFATSAMSTELFGGGATLPAGGYLGWNFLSSPTQSRLTLPANVDSASLFGAWGSSTGNSVQYCQTGSGAGKKALNGDTSAGFGVNNACGDFINAASNVGFGVPTTAIVQPDFAASDAPLSSTEYGLFVTNKGAVHGEPIQFPALAGSIAIVWKNSDFPAGTKLNLTNADVCNVLAGNITNWNQLHNLGTTVVSNRPIRVVYRSDGSGTSFNLSNHLSATCGNGVVTNGHFVTDQTFTNVVANLPLISAPVGLTANGQSGNPAVVTAVAAGDIAPSSSGPGEASIGYAETANTLDHGLGQPVSFFTVNGLSPVTDFATTGTFTLPSGSVVSDQVITGADATTGRPTVAAQTPHTTANCMRLVSPDSYAAPTSGYPIVAVTYLMANQKGNSTNLATLQSFLSNPYSLTHPGVTTVGANTGFAFLGGTGITSRVITGCTAA